MNKPVAPSAAARPRTAVPAQAPARVPGAPAPAAQRAVGVPRSVPAAQQAAQQAPVAVFGTAPARGAVLQLAGQAQAPRVAAPRPVAGLTPAAVVSAPTIGHTLAERWRPQWITDMVGSRKVLMDLGSAFASGNLRRAIAVLGPTGTGKTTLNMIIAKSVTCQTPGPDGRPCGTCASCQVFNEDEYKTKHPDIFVLNCSEKTGIDDIRATLQLARTYPLVGRHRVIFLDEAQGLSKQAEMALLKELEHPPAHTVILVGSMNPEQVSKAVLDRCYCIKLSTASDANGRASLAARLMHIAKAEGVEIQKDVALAIADISDGFQRNAVQTLDNVLNRIRSGQPIEIERLYDTIAEVASGSPFTLAKRALCAVYEGDVKAFIDAVSASENVLFMLRTMIQQSGEALRYSVDENSIQNVMAARTARDVVKSAVKSKLTAYQRAHVGRAFEDTLKLVSGYTVDAAAALVHTAVILDEQLKVQRK